ncbi:hypothetical protein [Saccharothrix sp.]|uniref:hypothetical protein n=1 Tax=Saccharothrix sp. TaxID=1873460 RepID=UPI0028127F88|nr:hypothetical protein [Saccharothrix sp.]
MTRDVNHSPITFGEVLVFDRSLPGTTRTFPALLHYGSEKAGTDRDSLVMRPAFRPEVLHEVVADRAARTGHAVPADIADWERCGPHHILVPDPAGWELVPDQPRRSPTFREDPLAVVDIPDLDLGCYVRAPADVEQRDPAEWVVVAAIMYRQTALIIVPAGRVALFEPELDEDRRPAVLTAEEDWYPRCRHCGRALYVPGEQPGMLYPAPAEDEDRPWCAARYDSDRRRPCAATYMLYHYETGAVISAGPAFDQLRAAHLERLAHAKPAEDHRDDGHLCWQRLEASPPQRWRAASVRGGRAVTYLVEIGVFTQRVWRDDTGDGPLTYLGSWPWAAEALRHAEADDLAARQSGTHPAGTGQS